MKRGYRISDAALNVLLGRGREIRPVLDVMRARALARARAAVAAGTVHLPGATATPVPRRSFRIAVAAAIALLIGAGGVAAAFRSGAFDRPAPQTSSPTTAAASAHTVRAEMAARPASAPAVAIGRRERRDRPGGPVTAQESYAAELRLLQRAQVVYAGRDFPEALVLVAEHARRFPNGRLAEEREALRVRSLASAEHGDEARRATAAFAARFPRSVLLPRLQKLAGAAD